MKFQYIAIFALAALLLGYAFGGKVGAGGILPGSKEDPLVSKSYADEYIQSRYEELTERVASLKEEVENLEQQIEDIPEGAGRVIKLTIGERTAYIGEKKEQLDTAPVIHNGNTMLPLRFVGESLGTSFDYDMQSKTVTFEISSRTVSMTIGEKTALVDGEPEELDIAPMINSGRTLVPVRFVGESFGADVDWDNATKKVTIKP